MRIRGKTVSFWLFLAKLLKVVRIRLAFAWPTMKAKIILRLLDCSYGKDLKVCGKVYFRPNGKDSIRIGRDVRITGRFLTNTAGITNPVMLECIQNGRIEIGDYSGLTSAIVSARKMIQIGQNVKIGANVRIFDHDFHSLDHRHRRRGASEFNNVETASVIIEDDVFVGTNAIILKGVHIGARSIIAAGSVVTLKRIPEDSLVAGNPSTIIRRGH